VNPQRRPLVVGNWKMHGNRPANTELLAAVVAARPFGADVAVCVPFVYLTETAAQLAGSDIRWGAQDVSAHAQGAYTGEVSAAMLAECGCRYVLVGHSERRQHHGEADELVAAKAQAALGKGVTPIVCVGETLEQRDAGEAGAVVESQVRGSLKGLSAERVGALVIAYEPVWAIGTGLTATAQDAQEICALIRGVVRTGPWWAGRVWTRRSSPESSSTACTDRLWPPNGAYRGLVA